MARPITHPEIRFWNFVEKQKDGCWIWFGNTAENGYGHFQLPNPKVTVLAHRFSYELNTGTKIPEGMEVCHKCDNRACVNPDHLFLGTRKENAMDCVEKGRQAKGEKNGKSKLKECEAKEVKRLAIDGKLPQWFIGKIFRISEIQVRKIKNGRTWVHLQETS